MSAPRTWWLLVIAVAGLLGGVISAVPASAQMIMFVPASGCLTGEFGPRNLVAGVSVNFTDYVRLYCGDPTKGVIHISEAHPIAYDGSDDDDISECLRKVGGRGSEIPAALGNAARQLTWSGGSATVVWDARSLEVISLFTNDSNNWAACARA